MRKARLGAWLLLFALPCAAQRGGEPELIPRFAPLKKLPATDPLKPVRRPVDLEDEPVYKILPPRDDLMRKPRSSALNAKAERREVLRLRTRLWFFDGGASARISEQVPPHLVTPEGLEVWEGETEEFGAGGMMLLYAAEFAPLSWLSFTAEYGQEKKTKGRYHDKYWVHSPDSPDLTYFPTGAKWIHPQHEDDLVLSANSRGSVDWSAATMYFRVLEARIAGQDDDSFRHALDVGAGAHQLRMRQRMTDREITRSDGRRYGPFPLNPLPGYDATYEALWRGGHAAMRDTVKFPKKFTLEGEVLWAPVGMEFRGDGYYNQGVGPGDLRAETPNYEDRARGSAIHMRFAGGWTWGPLTFEGGYQRLYFYSRTGRRRFHNFDGTKSEVQLDNATAEFGGFFAGANFRF